MQRDAFYENAIGRLFLPLLFINRGKKALAQASFNRQGQFDDGKLPSA